MPHATVVYCSCPNAQVAEDISRALVEQRLAACVQAIAGVASTYRWNGAIHSDSEVLLVIKSVRERFDSVRTCIAGLHPYELPEIIAVDIVAGDAPYIDWIARESAARERSP